MKFVKKLTALFLAIVMTMAMGITAFADNATTYTIKTADGDSHKYAIYQILTGTLDSEGKKLSTVSAGENFKTANGVAGKDDAGNATTNMTAAEAAEYIAANATGTDSQKLEVIKKFVDISGTAYKTVQSNSVEVPAGYYLIKDAESLSGKDDATTLYVVQVAGNVTITRKADKPTVEKKVKDINDSTETDKSDWKDSADHDVNDVIDFKLTATLPTDADDFAAYKSYKLVFHDTESAGLTFNSSSVVVKYGSTTLAANQYTVNTNPSDGHTFDITITDVKALDSITVTAGGVFTVEYTATLNENAVIGSKGNPNEVYLEYSNNPNSEGEGETGKTPEDKVIVFTYEVDVNKIDSSKQPLAGAGFTLYKFDAATNQYVQVGTEVTASQQTDGKYTSKFLRVDDGKYKLVETTVPDGYNKVKDIEFTIEATHTEGDNPALTELKANNFTLVSTTDGSISGVLSTDVENKKGSELPSTGGMGTTVIYVAGIAMIVAAGVVVIARKRMA